jgi:hypothetical protein
MIHEFVYFNVLWTVRRSTVRSEIRCALNL